MNRSTARAEVRRLVGDGAEMSDGALDHALDTIIDKGPWAPPFDEHNDMPDVTLRCAITGSVDADATCSCAGCSAARSRLLAGVAGLRAKGDY